MSQNTRALTRAGAFLPLGLILTSATSLVAQVLEVHLDLLAVLLHQGFTCLEETEGVTENLSFPPIPSSPSACPHTPALGGRELRSRVGHVLLWTQGVEETTRPRQQAVPPPE